MIKHLFYSQIIFITLFITSNQFPQPISVYSGTTIITVVRNDTLWIGADSKVVDTIKDTVYTVCKIISKGDVVFTNSGIIGDWTGNFNVYNLFMYSYDKGNTIFETMKIFGDSLILKFKEIGDAVFAYSGNTSDLKMLKTTTLFSVFIREIISISVIVEIMLDVEGF